MKRSCLNSEKEIKCVVIHPSFLDRVVRFAMPSPTPNLSTQMSDI